MSSTTSNALSNSEIHRLTAIQQSRFGSIIANDSTVVLHSVRVGGAHVVIPVSDAPRIVYPADHRRAVRTRRLYKLVIHRSEVVLRSLKELRDQSVAILNMKRRNFLAVSGALTATIGSIEDRISQNIKNEVSWVIDDNQSSLAQEDIDEEDLLEIVREFYQAVLDEDYETAAGFLPYEFDDERDRDEYLELLENYRTEYLSDIEIGLVDHEHISVELMSDNEFATYATAALIHHDEIHYVTFSSDSEEIVEIQETTMECEENTDSIEVEAHEVNRINNTSYISSVGWVTPYEIHEWDRVLISPQGDTETLIESGSIDVSGYLGHYHVFTWGINEEEEEWQTPYCFKNTLDLSIENVFEYNQVIEAYVLRVDFEIEYERTHAGDEQIGSDIKSVVIYSFDDDKWFVSGILPKPKEQELLSAVEEKVAVRISSLFSVPVAPVPSDDLIVESMVVSDEPIDESIPATLYIDDEVADEQTLDRLEEGGSRVQWEPDVDITPGEHTVRMVVDGDNEIDRIPSGVEETWSFDTPSIALKEFYTGAPKEEYTLEPPDRPDQDTVVLLRNLGEETITISSEFSVNGEIDAETEEAFVRDERIDYGDPNFEFDEQYDSTEDIQIPRESYALLQFWWDPVPGEEHTVTVSVDVEDGDGFEATKIYAEEVWRSLPSALAYAEGRPNIDSSPTHFSPRLRSLDVGYNEDAEELMFQFAGEGSIEVTVRDVEGTVIGETERESEEPTFVDVSIDPPEDENYLIVEVEEQSLLGGTLLAIPKLGTPWNLTGTLLQFIESLGSFVTEGEPADRQPEAPLFRFVYVLDLSGQPPSDEFLEFRDEIGNQYSWENFIDAVDGVLDLVGDWTNT